YVTPAAARLFLDGEDVSFLPELLYKMVGIGRRRLARGDDFDPLTSMARKQDEMSSRAQYVGVGVSSLETATLSWVEIQQNAFGPGGCPGPEYARPVDPARRRAVRARRARRGDRRRRAGPARWIRRRGREPERAADRTGPAAVPLPVRRRRDGGQRVPVQRGR